MNDKPTGPAADTVPFDDSASSEFIRAAAAPKPTHSIPFGEAFKDLPRSLKWAIVVPLLAFLITVPWLSIMSNKWITGIPFIPTSGGNFPAVLTGNVVPFVLITLGLNVVVGQAGLLDLGYVGFFAIGAYTMGVLTSKHASWDGILWLVALFIAVAVTMLAGVMLGAPTLRLRGDYLAIVTLGFGEIIRIIAKNTAWLGSAEGISNIKSMPSFLVFKIDVLESRWLWVVGLAVVALVIFALSLIENSRVGRAWAAIREDEDAAELMGVPTFQFKLWAFAIGAAVGGLGGVFYTTRTSAIYEYNFAIQQSILFLAAVVLGGLGNRWGAVLGGFVVAWGPEKLRDLAPEALKEKYEFFNKIELLRFFLFGLVLLFMMIFRPQGLLPRRVKARRAAGDSGEAVATDPLRISAGLANVKVAAAGLVVPFVGLWAMLRGNKVRDEAHAAGEPEPSANRVARRIGVVGLIASLFLTWMLIRPHVGTRETFGDEFQSDVLEDGSGGTPETQDTVVDETVDSVADPTADAPVDTVLGGES